MRMRKEVFILSLDDILPNRFQPRIKFDEKAILELSESIRKHGVIQPIIVRKIADKYEIIAGERRYKASLMAGRKTIPAIITDVDDKESAEIALIENVQRQDMTPIEEAISYKKILDMGYLNQSELAIKLGRTQSTIANKLRLLNLSDEVQEALLEEKISERHARSLLRLPVESQPEILNRIITERLTVRKTDQLINSILNKEEVKEEKGDKVNNNINDINNNYNIPSEPIVNSVEPNTNPGFMNIDQIANTAQDIEPATNNIVGDKPPFNPFGNSSDNNVSQVSQPEVPVQEAPVTPEFNQQPEAPSAPTFGPQPNPGFNPFATSQPEVPVQEAPVTPEFNQQPEVPSAPTFGPQPNPGFNPFAASQPEVPVQEAPVTPEFNQQPEAPSAPSFGPQPNPGFNPFAAPQPEVPAQEAPVASEFNQQPEVSSTPDLGFGPMPQPEPNPGFNPFNINTPMEQTSMNENISSPSFISTPNYPLPENQELTPLMPESMEQANKVELNTVINTLRDCIKQIEGYGYKVDSDELDLSDTYEFTIKIEKN